MNPDDDATVTALREAMAAETSGHHLDRAGINTASHHLTHDEFAAAGSPVTLLDGRRPSRRPSRRLGAFAAAALVAAFAVVVTAITVVIVSARHEPARPAAGAGSACAFTPTTGPLPGWARAGFTPADAPQRYVLGRRGAIVAILFVDPLVTPPQGNVDNKILWVAGSGATGQPLVIHATLAGTDTVVRRVVAGGPGPSTINLPGVGCWRLDLTWSGHRDTLDLAYVAARHG